MSDFNHGIKLADGTFFDGSIGKSVDKIEMVLSIEVAAEHLADLMSFEKTKWIGYYVNQLISEYKDYEFVSMYKDVVESKVNVWLKKKGEN